MDDFQAAEVRRLRTVEQLSVREIRARTGLGRNRVQELKRYRVATGRLNTGDGYHGCPTVEVPRSRGSTGRSKGS
ncbi:hypothetical protein ACFY2R_02430 [Micromonospora olivasterospora]|uniref:Sigma-70-like protein n=1 Tax=Micromonospora olivasterospora TaxID=1880 RepID=A0A562IBA7_MICOL|nr:hypothetical protein [Micromonospora olivasterospora]TWH68277.1 hypothetical protein JD77_03268 [Micromonospora olivasterospora]